MTMLRLCYASQRLHRSLSVPCTSVRGIVTSSITPPVDVTIERPEMIVLSESMLYNHSWKYAASNFYPSNGLHFSSIDIMQPSSIEQPTTLKSIEHNMVQDLSNLNSSSAHVVLVARGPIQCLVAQYFLESLPLAGLVMVDPLILPVDGRTEKSSSSSRWKSSLDDLMLSLKNKAPRLYDGLEKQPFNGDDDQPTHPLQLPNGFNLQPSLEIEHMFLYTLANDDKQQHNRSLKLETGSIPILVMHSGDHKLHDYYRVCAERTAAFHTCGGRGDYFDQVSVLQIPIKKDENDLDGVMKIIYEWYDEVVA